MLFACPNREVLVLRLGSVTVLHQECDILSQREVVFIERVLASLPYTDKLQNGRRSIIRGLGVACWPLVPKFSGSNPAEAVGFLGRKNPQHAFLRRGSKAVGPMS